MICLQYWAKKDANGFPIPGTMMGRTSNPCKCDLVRIYPTDTFIGDNGDGTETVQAYHPNKLRYFVHINCDGEVIPNSLFISLKHPGGNVAEFKKTYIQPIE